ncbi:hypothetical protein JTE90_010678 [Oedothorax gibbosus]|uniref:Uncharacterized protein n=1 Tax=Oedothorax gibbosus TaxID=931172 RepID=A0AAV6URP6_9ARAC|nr:hypothetical protein JTE90_010678 [Oedothorax gibbosus]
MDLVVTEVPQTLPPKPSSAPSALPRPIHHSPHSTLMDGRDNFIGAEMNCSGLVPMDHGWWMAGRGFGLPEGDDLPAPMVIKGVVGTKEIYCRR